MENKEMPAEYKDKLLLSFVETGWADPSRVDPKFRGWVAGRMEIYTYEGEYDIDEKTYIAPYYTEEWRKFEETYESERDKDELEKVIKTLKEKFHRIDENGWLYSHTFLTHRNMKK